MTTEKQIEIAEHLKSTGLVTQIYHSCQLLKDEEHRTMYPVYKKGAEFMYSGIDDTRGLFAYIRDNGDIVTQPLKLQSCSKAYQVTAPLRVVFYHDSDKRDFSVLTTQLSTFTFLGFVNLVRVITDKNRLMNEESPTFNAKFDAKTFYVAFDITVRFDLMPNSCDVDNCKPVINPIKCLAAVQESISFVS